MAECSSPSPPPPSIDKISISGGTLSALLHRFSSSSGDLHGLLFGRLALLPPPLPTDEDDLLLPPSPTAVAVLTGHCSIQFFDSIGRTDPSLLSVVAGTHHDSSSVLLGWFSARRRSPLRPSMRELAVSFSIRSNLHSTSTPLPLILLLLSEGSTPNDAIHTHEYRAFSLSAEGDSLDPKSIDIVNLGPGFGSQYGGFSPACPLPLVTCNISKRNENEKDVKKGMGETLASQRKAIEDKEMLDASAEGFDVERLWMLAGSGPVEYAAELEDLYRKMLHKLESLARLVEKSSAKVLDQESYNINLRSKIAGLE